MEFKWSIWFKTFEWNTVFPFFTETAVRSYSYYFVISSTSLFVFCSGEIEQTSGSPLEFSDAQKQCGRI